MIYGLVLVAALAHALWNSIVKGSQDHLLMLGAIRSVGLLVGGIVACFVPLPAAASLPFLLTAAAVHYVYYACMLNAYRLGDLGQVYPISRGMAPLVVTILGIVIAGEYLDGWKLAAIFLISTGLLSLSFFTGKTAIQGNCLRHCYRLDDRGLYLSQRSGHSFGGVGTELYRMAGNSRRCGRRHCGHGPTSFHCHRICAIALADRNDSRHVVSGRLWDFPVGHDPIADGSGGCTARNKRDLCVADRRNQPERKKFSLPRFAAACSVAVGIIVLTSPHAA
ncbi:hypothetical protein ACFS07_16320 [Undibacterium arcticum]